MTNEHSITPPPELVQQWIGDYYGCPVSGELAGVETAIATRAAQWGADQELQAVCQLLFSDPLVTYTLSDIRAARRPKPPSLKELALEALDAVDSFGNEGDRDTIRRALEQLDD